MKKGGDKKIFIDIANEVGSLVQEKNEAYGDSFAKSQDIVKILFPDGVEPHQYRDMLAVTRVIDKLFRIATNKDAFGESPWRDICGYAILGIANDEGDKREQQQEKEEAKAKQEEEPYEIPPEIVRELVIQRVRDRREEGHANPYANIDRGDEEEEEGGDNSSHDILTTSEQALLREAIEDYTEEPTPTNDVTRDVRLSYDNGGEGNKNNNAVSYEHEHWGSVVTRATRTSKFPEYKRRE